MGQTAVKTFFNSSHSTLGAELNAWLAQQAGQVTIRSISLDSNEYGHCLSLLCELAPGPAYRALVVFNNSHRNLEDEANRVLATFGPCQMMAVGSNQYGHCLCLIQAAQPPVIG